eukprot:CAMPEP_0116013582 /NCGR_PEP_ID=MMETSP0321-20121206/5807_1 /TAXON_ID=163516 /ORGANISM="Leptocylindrus danicus var. danicus, Strain B650" /LENGTH=234 /DNA_ID=CAMNT_0003483149 /DNA_START=63 /DNA_END=767 /DNA_ORIENTATION=-
MSQTLSVARQQPLQPLMTAANTNTSTNTNTNTAMTTALNLKKRLTRCATQEESLSILQSLNRKDLLFLYRLCAAPSSTDLYAGKVWDGFLLNNNSLVMTQITAFITNQLFGKGSKWKGKSFDAATGDCNGTGKNQFIQPTTECVEAMHAFEYDSKGVSAIDGKQSMMLRYSSFHPFISPWHTMVDELRVLREPDEDGEGAIMLCLGYMAWSGGCLNSSPFYLATPSTRGSTPAT